jgi:hypothetical protein
LGVNDLNGPFSGTLVTVLAGDQTEYSHRSSVTLNPYRNAPSISIFPWPDASGYNYHVGSISVDTSDGWTSQAGVLQGTNSELDGHPYVVAELYSPTFGRDTIEVYVESLAQTTHGRPLDPGTQVMVVLANKETILVVVEGTASNQGFRTQGILTRGGR